MLAAPKRHGADVDRDALAVRADHDNRRVRDVILADHLPGEELARATRLLGRDDGGELVPVHVADECLRRRVHPAHDARGVDQIARDVQELERLDDVLAHQLKHGSRHLLCTSWAAVPALVERRIEDRRRDHQPADEDE